MRNSIILFFICIQSLSVFCQIEGHYARGGYTGMVNETFCFSYNSFTFMSNGDLADFRSTGTYEIYKDTLTLNSHLQLKDLVQLKQFEIKKLDSVHILISTLSQTVPYETTLIINDSIKQTYNLKNDEIIKFPKGYIKSLSVNCFFVTWQIQKLKFEINEHSSIIEIFVDDTKGLRNAFFSDSKYLLKKNKLIDVNNKESFFIKSPNGKCR